MYGHWIWNKSITAIQRGKGLFYKLMLWKQLDICVGKNEP